MVTTMNDLGRILIIVGLGIALVGWFVSSGWGRGWFGRLPGDIHWSQGNASFHFPIVTCLLLSILLSVLMWLFRR